MRSCLVSCVVYIAVPRLLIILVLSSANPSVSERERDKCERVYAYVCEGGKGFLFFPLWSTNLRSKAFQRKPFAFFLGEAGNQGPKYPFAFFYNGLSYASLMFSGLSRESWDKSEVMDSLSIILNMLFMKSGVVFVVMLELCSWVYWLEVECDK